MSHCKAWWLVEDIAGYDPVEVAPSDNKAKNNTTLVDPFDIVRDPRDGVGDARVDPESAEECAGVLDPRFVGAEEHSEADDTEEGDSDVAEAPSASPIGDVTNRDS